MKNILIHIYDFLKKPFEENLLLFLLIFVIIFFPSAYFYRSVYQYFVYLSLTFYVIAYFITLLIGVCGYIGRKTRIFFGSLIVVLLFLLNMPRFLGVYVWGLPLTGDAYGIICQTTGAEALEFLSANISSSTIVSTILATSILGVSICFALCKSFRPYWYKSVRYIGFSILLISAPLLIRNSTVFFDENPITEIKDAVSNSVFMSEHLCHPVLVETSPNHPQRIVVIIGESFSKYHSSLYGYEKKTNPLLSELEEQSKLFVFDSVKSPANSTSEVFKYILNTHRLGDTTLWYDTPNLIEVMEIVGYHTTWISSQASKGVTSNISSGLSEICNESYFNPKRNKKYGLDENLLNIFYSVNHNSADKRFGYTLDVFHLLGQHVVFSLRYPPSFNRFSEKDYLNFPEYQRENLASYDNATLYNDSIVYSIMMEYKDEEAIVFYLSDHGLDIYYVDDYCAHGRPSNKKSSSLGKDIPFMIYVTDKYKEKYPEVVDRIAKSTDNPYCTDSFIFTVMDIAGWEFEDDKYKTGKSIINHFSY